MSKRIWTFLTILVVFSFLLSGCYFAARNQIKSAEKSFAELKAEGGEKLTPYEYCSAEAYLESSKIEFNEADYSSAKRLAERSKGASEAGLSEVKKKK